MNKLATLAAAAVLLTGMAAAAGDDLPNAGMTPDSPFYFVEQFVEDIEVAVAGAPVVGSEDLAAKVRANNAAERLSEAKKISERNGSSEKVNRLMERYNQQMEKSEKLASRSRDGGNLSGEIENLQGRQLGRLEQLRDDLPANARKGLDKAIENAKNRSSPNVTPGKSGKNGNIPEAENKRGRTVLPEQELNSTGKNRSNAENPIKSSFNRKEAEKPVENLSGQNLSNKKNQSDRNVSPEDTRETETANETVSRKEGVENQVTGAATKAPGRR